MEVEKFENLITYRKVDETGRCKITIGDTLLSPTIFDSEEDAANYVNYLLPWDIITSVAKLIAVGTFIELTEKMKEKNEETNR